MQRSWIYVVSVIVGPTEQDVAPWEARAEGKEEETEQVDVPTYDGEASDRSRLVEAMERHV